MKSVLLALSILAVLTRCAKEELTSAGQSSLSQEVEIALNETLDLPESAKGNDTPKVRVHLAEINDSRCPMNVNCIRYGSAVVRLWLEIDKDKSPIAALVIGEALPSDTRKLRNRTADTTLVTVANTQYQIILKNVSPYPCSGCPDQEPKSAQIIVTAQ
ncbi:hypothetical protein HUW51_04470 [Adhaeribacter swui]|uniref:Uncharacterized protein n=1 Tax=Adhaeribacter swui TaxID=2086471 RepID=A0A7G7G4D2_9BACT|nr:hypothetical protein [Adhaeribacter swui]QNF32016.1 hypothetical protein HUW51_04470 [Adhaeribacter swui]